MAFGFKKGFTIVSVVIGVAVVTLSYVIYTQSSKLLSQQSKALTDGLVAEMYATELLELLRSFSDERLRRYISVNPEDSRIGSFGPPAVAPAAPPVPLLCTNCTVPKFCTRFNENPPTPTLPVPPTNPIADLPAINALSRLDAPTLAPNRWYMVQLVDLAATDLLTPTVAQIEVLMDYCVGLPTETTPRQIDLVGDPNSVDGRQIAGNPETVPAAAPPVPPPAPKYPPSATTRLLITVGVSWVPKGKMTDLDRKSVVLSTIIPSNRVP